MRVVLQRVKYGKLLVKDKIISEIGKGLFVLLGIGEGDTDSDIDWLAAKIANLRIFEDSEAKLNKSLLDIKGEVLLVSQFTLYADCKKGRRPSFDKALKPEKAEELFIKFNNCLRSQGVEVKIGVFGADMNIELVNYGPVTILLDSQDR
ncbi:MAG: D-aminoacyl-tRNA deacylase [Candidatus Kaelpia aquatica]|nr:D-aminoacyl-tRNA deacylase [Candidatus Kaelpia aquatica]